MSASVFDGLVRVLQTLRGAQNGDPFAEQEATLTQAANALDGLGNQKLTAAQDWKAIHTAIAALSAAATLRPAAMALGTARAISPQSKSSPDRAAARRVLCNLAIEQTLRALTISYPLDPMPLGPPVVDAALQSHLAPAPPTPDGTAHSAVLDNIARYHREHERYYSAYLLEQGALLAREANKLKVLADLWQQDGETVSNDPSVDFSNPAYRVAGCDDLNPLPSIAYTGILFMEGQSEPTEIRMLKALLGSRSAASIHAGKWLAEATVAAWRRESAMLYGPHPAAAEPRFRTIATNWVGAQETVLVGRLLGLTAEILSAMDFSPAGIRGNRHASGQRLETAARILTAAARIQAKSGIDLSTNDEHWTEYRALLKRRDAPAGQRPGAETLGHKSGTP